MKQMKFLAPRLQWNLGIEDTLGAELLSSGGRFIQITIYSHNQGIIIIEMIMCCLYGPYF